MPEYDAEQPRRTGVGRIVTTGRALASYALFAVGIALLGSFFAPFLGFPGVAFHTEVLPTIAAPTENQRQFINVAPLIGGILASAVAVWLR